MWDFSDTPSEDMNFKEKEEKHVLSVSEAIIVIKENITRIPLLTVVGEVSGFRVLDIVFSHGEPPTRVPTFYFYPVFEQIIV